MTANFAYRQHGYAGVNDWGVAVSTTREHFAPLETFGERFEDLIAEVQALGFDTVDLWTEHLAERWATPDHLDTTASILERRGVRVVALAGGFGDTLEAFEHSCRIAVRLGAKILGGGTGLLKSDRAGLIRTLEEHDLVYAFENHAQKNPNEVLERIGDAANGRIGVAVDTGWFATQGFDAARAIRELGERVVHVHLKDVLRAGTHETCRFGRGVTPLRDCLRAMREIGYSGPVDIEHEPERFDPSEDIRASRVMLESWIKETP
jgi:sugar phosphate isomerase/epimerase